MLSEMLSKWNSRLFGHAHHDRDRFAKHGYLIFNPGIPASVLDGAVDDLKGKYNTTETLRVSYKDERRIQDAWNISEHCRNIALFPTVLEKLEELYGRKPKPFQTLNFHTGTEQATHSDVIHFNSIPSGFMCGVWIALEDISTHQGPLVYYPGSHLLPEITMKDVKAEPNYDNYPLYERYIEKQIRDLNLKGRTALLRKGEALIWAANLLHGGSKHIDKTRSRQSQVTHYYFENCEYYTPMLSTAERIHFRELNWVR